MQYMYSCRGKFGTCTRGLSLDDSPLGMRCIHTVRYQLSLQLSSVHRIAIQTRRQGRPVLMKPEHQSISQLNFPYHKSSVRAAVAGSGRGTATDQVAPGGRGQPSASTRSRDVAKVSVVAHRSVHTRSSGGTDDYEGSFSRCDWSRNTIRHHQATRLCGCRRRRTP